LFRDVEIQWTGAAKYLRRFVTESPVTAGPFATVTNATDLASKTVEVGGKRARGRVPKKRKAIKEEMRAGIRAGKFTTEALEDMLEKEMAHAFRASRDTCRKARNELLSELKLVGQPIRDK
jgi:hypothetical protein